MTIKHLKIFVSVYQKMNVTKAAEELHMAQPAVTRVIKEMETYYGVTLFERLNRRIYATETADELYARAIHIMEAFDSLEEVLKRSQGMRTLRVGGTMTMGTFILPKAVKEFQERYPDIKIKVKISNSRQIQKMIRDNALDLALVEENVQADYLEKEYFSSDGMCLIFPKGHPLEKKPSVCMEDLKAFPILLREKGSAGRTYIEHILAIHEISVDPIWESTSSQALIHAVANGLGISILPETLVAADLAEGRICSRAVTDESFCRNAYVIWHKQKFFSESMENFKLLCKKFTV